MGKKRVNLRLIARQRYKTDLKTLLTRMYWDENKDQYKIAAELGCAVSTVSTNFKKLNIPVHPRGTFQRSYKMSPEHREKLRRIHKGKVVSAETRRKLAESRKGKSYIGKSARFTGTRKHKRGYIQVYLPDHPHATKDGYVMEHRLVMERHIGRYLSPEEEVHHINGIKSDNRIENLQLFASKADHMRHHMLERHAERRKNKCRSIG